MAALAIELGVIAVDEIAVAAGSEPFLAPIVAETTETVMGSSVIQNVLKTTSLIGAADLGYKGVKAGIGAVKTVGRTLGRFINPSDISSENANKYQPHVTRTIHESNNRTIQIPHHQRPHERQDKLHVLTPAVQVADFEKVRVQVPRSLPFKNGVVVNKRVHAAVTPDPVGNIREERIKRAKTTMTVPVQSHPHSYLEDTENIERAISKTIQPGMDHANGIPFMTVEHPAWHRNLQGDIESHIPLSIGSTLAMSDVNGHDVGSLTQSGVEETAKNPPPFHSHALF